MASVNNMSIYQASTLLNAVVQQATGQSALASTGPNDFVSVATTLLKTGYDPVINAISQVWSRTIFSVRPYNAKLAGLEMNLDRWGNAVRKLSIADKPAKDDDRFIWPTAYDPTQTANPTGEGVSVDMYPQCKPDVLQTNFYGQFVYENCYTTYKDNYDVAFSGPEEFMRFNEMVAQNRTDKLEQWRETLRRGLLGNLIAAIYAENQPGRIVHLLTEYNTETGLQLTATTVMQPENYVPFMRWARARVMTIARLMTNRSELYQTVINGKHVMRHTRPDDLKVYLSAAALDRMSTVVDSITFNDELLRYADYEAVDYWQSIRTPSSVITVPVYTGTDGTIVQAESAVTVENIFGVMFDRDALGYAEVTAWAMPTPMNPRNGQVNIFDHVNARAIMDMTEKAVVLLLD